MSERQGNVVVDEGTIDQKFTAKDTSNNLTANAILVNVKNLERYFNERIDRQIGNVADTVEDRIQNAILTAFDSTITPKIELAVGSINASSGRDMTSVKTNLERGKRIENTVAFENEFERNNILQVLNRNDGTRNNIPDEVSEWSVPRTHFDASHRVFKFAECRLLFKLIVDLSFCVSSYEKSHLFPICFCIINKLHFFEFC